MKRVVVVGAGIGGLTAAALLLKAGCAVTVLEAQAYPGGSAGTFHHQGYRFDAGATLAGGFAPGGPHARLGQTLGIQWPVQPVDPAWITHLPGLSVVQWSDRRRWREERARAFPGSDVFWDHQERLADLAWDMSSRPFPWPPASARDLAVLARSLSPRLIAAAPWAARSVGAMLPSHPPSGLTAFLDANLLISAQAPAARANALYGSAALDLPRRGVNHVPGGIGALAGTLAAWIRSNGGQVRYRQTAGAVHLCRGRVAGVSTRKGAEFGADAVIANLTPPALAAVLGAHAPPDLHRDLPELGAFTLYVGLEDAFLPPDLTDHHQVVVDPARPLGEGNSVFLSLSPRQDTRRAPPGMRAMTLSTHTAVQPWWDLLQRDPPAYAARKEEYTQRCLAAAERAVPGLRAAVRLCLPGTPATFQFYTGRVRGLVGGYPQTSLWRVRGPRTGIPGLYLVGDSIFPGQSTAAVTLGAMRAAEDALLALRER